MRKILQRLLTFNLSVTSFSERASYFE